MNGTSLRISGSCQGINNGVSLEILDPFRSFIRTTLIFNFLPRFFSANSKSAYKSTFLSYSCCFLRFLKMLKIPHFITMCVNKIMQQYLDVSVEYLLTIRVLFSLLSSQYINRERRDFNPFRKISFRNVESSLPWTLLAETPGSCLNKTRIGRSCQNDWARVEVFRSFSRFLRAAGDAGTRPSTYIGSLSLSHFRCPLLAFSVPAGNPFEKWPLWITRIEILRRGVGELRGRCQILALLPRDAVPPTAYVSKQD